MPTAPLPNIIKIFQPHTQEFGLEIHSGKVTRKQPQQRLSLQNIKIFQTIKKLLGAQEFG